MSREIFGRRLENLFATLSAEGFLNNRGIGNEIGFYIFAYAPEFEPIVGGYLPNLMGQLTGAGVNVVNFNLYELILELLDKRDLLQPSFDLETKKGSAGLEKALKRIVRPERIVELMTARLKGPHDLVFVTGVGAAYPLLRSHTVLNNLHPVIDKVPVVMFFPGSYTGQELKLFDELKDDNYYRAFPLLQEAVNKT